MGCDMCHVRPGEGRKLKQPVCGCVRIACRSCPLGDLTEALMTQRGHGPFTHRACGVGCLFRHALCRRTSGGTARHLNFRLRPHALVRLFAVTGSLGGCFWIFACSHLRQAQWACAVVFPLAGSIGSFNVVASWAQIASTLPEVRVGRAAGVDIAARLKTMAGDIGERPLPHRQLGHLGLCRGSACFGVQRPPIVLASAVHVQLSRVAGHGGGARPPSSDKCLGSIAKVIRVNFLP